MEAFIKPVIWTTRALKDLKEISMFNSKIYGEEKALELAHKIIDFPDILENSNYDFRNIGSVDESFSHLKREYRKLFSGHYKISYRDGKTKIYITRVFDTRRHPNRNK